MQGLSSPVIPSATLSMAFKRETVFISYQSSKTWFFTGLFTEVTITSKISLNASSSAASTSPSQRSKLTSLKSRPIEWETIRSKKLLTKLRVIPLSSAVPVDLNSEASTESMSNESQYFWWVAQDVWFRIFSFWLFSAFLKYYFIMISISSSFSG